MASKVNCTSNEDSIHDFNSSYFGNKIIDKGFLAVIVISISLVACILLLSTILFRLCRRAAYLEKRVDYLIEMPSMTKPPLQFASDQILKKISNKKDQKKWKRLEYCVVSFDPNTQEKHSMAIKNCLQGRPREKQLNEKPCLIQDSKDIGKIPHCEVIFIFVDMIENKEFEILENPAKDLNDLRLLTVRCCQKLVAEDRIFVVCIGDAASENLMPGLLYNPQIPCITEHPDLKEMERKDRVITCYKEFTITQREKIAEFIV